MKTDAEGYKRIRLEVQRLIDFVLNSVDEPNNDEVQQNLNVIEEAYWRCFDH